MQQHIVGDAEHIEKNLKNNEQITFGYLSEIIKLRNWSVRARVTKKYPLKVSKAGKVYMKIEMIDDKSDYADAIFYSEIADHYNKEIVQGKEYIFSNGIAKFPHPTFARNGTVCEIVFSELSSIIENDNDAELISCDVPEINIKNQNDGKKYKYHSSGDDEDHYNDHANNGKINEISRIRSANSLSDGQNIGEKSDEMLRNDNDFSETLKNSVVVPAVRDPSKINYDLSTIYQIISFQNKTAYPVNRDFDVLCTVGKINISDIVKYRYQGCIGNNCKRKLEKIAENQFFCNSCSVVSSRFVYRYRLILPLHDSTGCLNAKVFDRQASDLLDIQAYDFYDILNQDSDKAEVFLIQMFGKKIIATINVHIDERGYKENILARTIDAENAFKTIFKEVCFVADNI